MLKFIVCEDNEIIRKKNISVINKVMFSNNVNYNIFEFNSYNNDLLDIINDNSGRKVFILDIELGSKSGIDIARLIRKNDWESFIIISTAHYELFPQVFIQNKGALSLLTLIFSISKNSKCIEFTFLLFIFNWNKLL